MQNQTVKLGYSKTSPADLVTQGRTHEEKLTGNPNYTLPPALLTALKNASDALEAANIKVNDNGGKTDHLLRNERVVDLKAMIKEVAGYVQAQSGGDLEKIVSAGFEARKPRHPSVIPSAPLGMRAENTKLPGQLKLRWQGVANRIYYAVWITTGDPGSEIGWTLVGQTSKNFFLVEDLTSDKVYSFRVNAVTTAGAGTLSTPITAKAA